MAGTSMLYSPTPMKRRSSKKIKTPKRHNSSKNKDSSTKGGLKQEMLSSINAIDNEGKDLDDSKRSAQDSLSSKLQGSTVSTVAMYDSDCDSDCNRSFFSDAISTISELPKLPKLPERLGTESPRSISSKKNKRNPTKKKKKKKDKSSSTPDTPKTKKKKKSKSSSSTDTPKKTKKSSKKKRDKPAKSPAQPAKDQITKLASLSHLQAVHEASSDDDSFLGEAFRGTQRVVPQIQQLEEEQELEPQELPYGPPLWGDTDDEKSFEDAWEEDKSWNGWDNENDDRSEYIEETICDESHDGFSYYTIQSNDELHDDLGMGLFDEDIEDDDYTIESNDNLDMDFLVATDKQHGSSKKKSVRFDERETVHETLHICDFTKKEIRRTWFQQKDYEATIQVVKEVAGSCETPQDTQTRWRKQRSSLSKTAETRGLEAWTPSGVQRFRYVKEAAFRAVWDEQQKQLDRVEALDNTIDDDKNEDDDNSVIADTENISQAYQRVSTKSLKEAQKRAKRDEEIATKLQPRSSKRGSGRRGSWEMAMGSSSRGLLDGNSSHHLSDNLIPVNSPPSCLRKQIDSSPGSEHGTGTGKRNSKLWFGESARGLARKRSDRGISKQDRGTIKPPSDHALFKKMPERGLFKQLSDRNLFKEKPERGIIRQSSERFISNKPKRGLFRQMSDRGLFKVKPDQGDLSKQSSDRSLFKKSKKSKTPERGLFKQISDRSLFSRNPFAQKSSEFDSIADRKGHRRKWGWVDPPKRNLLVASLKEGIRLQSKNK